MLSRVQVIHGHQSQLRNIVKRIVIGLHLFYHDGSIATYDLDTKEFKYLKFERITGVKWQCHDDLTSWIKYLNYLNYGLEDIISIFLVNCSDILPNLSSNTFPNRERIMVVDHHECHHHSTSNLNSIVLDDTGSQHDCLSIFKKHKFRVSHGELIGNYGILEMNQLDFLKEVFPKIKIKKPVVFNLNVK